MRTSIASATFLLLGAGAVAVGAAEPGGDNIALNGSDTIKQVTLDVIGQCDGTHGAKNGNVTGHGISYLGGGSGVGEAQMQSNSQQMAPMSRALKNTAYCGTSTQNQTNALVIAVDGVSVMANTANACSPDLAQAGRSFQYVDANNNTQTYTFTSSLDVLRLVYAGLDNTGAFNCGGPIRKSLVQNWQAIFNANCGTAPNCPAAFFFNGASGPETDATHALTHAWRRSDLSGTTDAFVNLVGFGSRKIGGALNPDTGLPFPGSSAAVNPFCNSADANGGPATFGGASDYSDNDPIRVFCDGNAGDPAGGESVCEADGTLGLVLPVLLPDVSGITTADTYPVPQCGSGCALSQTGLGALYPCPRHGPKKGGRCYMPVIVNPDGSKNFQCWSDFSKKCPGDKDSDGRAYNLPLHIKNGSEGAFYATDSQGNPTTGSFYRIHMHKATTYAPSTAASCQLADDTQSIGCLVNSDPCSIGFAGREADKQAGNQAETVNGIAPTNANITSLLGGVNACKTNADCSGRSDGKTVCNTIFGQCYTPTAVVYPLARRLYVASLVGIGALQGGEQQLSHCFGDNNIMTPIVMQDNFVPMPSGVQCLDYPETSPDDTNAFLPQCCPSGSSTCTTAVTSGGNGNACSSVVISN